MGELKIEVGKKEFSYTIPEGWGDLSQEDFCNWVRIMGRKLTDSVTKEMVCALTHLEAGSALMLSAVEWFALEDALEWSLDISTLDGLLMESLTVEGVEMVGYEPDFSNTTWEEFIAADTFATAGNNAGLASVLYRPRREPYDPEKDVRIDYTAYGAMNRREAFSHANVVELEAVKVNYMVLRNRMASRYPHVFLENATEAEREEGKGFSWTGVTKAIVGDKIEDWESFSRLPVDVVLSRLESVIIEQNRQSTL